jgi:hypothetical protein
MNKPNIFVCECCSHAIGVSKWDDDLFLTFWDNEKQLARGRLYWVWQALKGNWAGSSEVILNIESQQKLISILKNKENNTIKEDLIKIDIPYKLESKKAKAFIAGVYACIAVCTGVSIEKRMDDN